MAIHTINHTDDSGLSLYAFPADSAYSLVDWTTHRVALAERAGPDVGIYDATLDDAKGVTWLVFEGANQPAGYAYAIAKVDLLGEQIAADAAAAKAAAEYGVSGTIDDEAATVSTFKLSADFSSDDALYAKRALIFGDGAYAGVSYRITAYDGPNRRVTIYPALPAAPADGTAVRIAGLIL